MKSLRYLALVVVVGAFSSCETAPTHPMYSFQTQGTAHTTRSLAAADTPLINQFLDELASKSSLESRDAFDHAFMKMANDDGSRDIKSTDDLQKMSDADQKKLISEVLNNPNLEKELAVSLDAAKLARLHAINFTDVHGIRTADVPDLKKSAEAVTDKSNTGYFSNFVHNNPAASLDIQEMVNESKHIEATTGIPILGKGCDSITNTEAMENLELIVDGVDHDVQVGSLRKAEDVPPAVEREMGYVTGASKDEAHNRVRALSDPKGSCGVFSPGIGGF
jgi:hypothetical protein